MSLLKIIDSKIKIAVRPVDLRTASQVQEVWSLIGASPSCPSAYDILKKIHRICHQGLNDRGKALQETVLETLKGVEKTINDRMIEQILELAGNNFPEDQYLSFIKNTKGVYERRNAPKHKYGDRAFEHELALMTCGSANLSRHAIGALKTSLEELLFKTKLNKKPALRVFIEWVALPAMKWTFGIISALIIATILYVVGIKS